MGKQPKHLKIPEKGRGEEKRKTQEALRRKGKETKKASERKSSGKKNQ